MREIGPSLVKNFFLDYFSIDWNETLKTEEQNIDFSTEIFLNKINEVWIAR